MWFFQSKKVIKKDHKKIKNSFKVRDEIIQNNFNKVFALFSEKDKRDNERFNLIDNNYKNLRFLSSFQNNKITELEKDVKELKEQYEKERHKKLNNRKIKSIWDRLYFEDSN